MRAADFLKAGALFACVATAACERDVVSYKADVQPLLDQKCVRCHADAAEGEAVSGLSLENYQDLLGGTKFGPVVVPGSPESSALYLVVAHKTAPEIHMPPHHEDALAEGRGTGLTDEQVEDIHDWIVAGAPNN
jgi:hypothetical protein